MSQLNRLARIVHKTSSFPTGIRTFVWSKAFGRTVPMVGTAKLTYLDVTHSRVAVKVDNRRIVQNHIGQVHACAMALIAETATGFVTGMNVPDNCVVLIKSLHVDFRRPTRGAMTAVATLTDEQRELMQTTEKGEVTVAVTVTDESGEEPIRCEMVWAWVSKARLKKKKE